MSHSIRLPLISICTDAHVCVCVYVREHVCKCLCEYQITAAVVFFSFFSLNQATQSESADKSVIELTVTVQPWGNTHGHTHTHARIQHTHTHTKEETIMEDVRGLKEVDFFVQLSSRGDVWRDGWRRWRER